MNRLISFLGGAIAGAGVLAAVACVITHLTEEAAPAVTDVAANVSAHGGYPSPTTDNSAESA